MIRKGLLWQAFVWIGIGATITLSFTGCGASHPPPLSAAAGTRGSLLASVDVGLDHAVTFWEFMPGLVGINETAAVEGDGRNQAPVLKARGRATVVEIYRSILRDPSAPVPAALVDADRHLAERRDRQGLVPRGARASAAGGSDPSCDNHTAVCPAGCSPDHDNDKWGEKWFRERYCLLPTNYCFTNQTGKWADWIPGFWYFTAAMAADFEEGARFKGGHYEYVRGPLFGLFPGEWIGVEDWNQFVEPRHVSFWTILYSSYGHSDAKGLDPCKRIHFSALAL